MNRNICKTVITNGGTIVPLILSSTDTNGTGLMNPSIYLDNDKLLVNIRHVNYLLYHSENNQLFSTRYGPLAYLNPENDMKLKTNNFICELNSDLTIKEYHKVNTDILDNNPVWEFHGLEDARLVRWDDKLYLSGVRRDVKPDGQGRIELSEIEIKQKEINEISRIRFPGTGNDASYCEKNWMPIIDMPYHYVKWCNPTEVVQVDPVNKTTTSLFVKDSIIPNINDLRGGSQVLSYGDYRICIVHEVRLFKNKLGQKDATYQHRFIIWNKDWEIVKLTDLFSFMDGEVEFACGMTFYKSDLLISFGFQDNAAYVLRIPNKMINEVLDFKLI